MLARISLGCAQYSCMMSGEGPVGMDPGLQCPENGRHKQTKIALNFWGEGFSWRRNGALTEYWEFCFFVLFSRGKNSDGFCISKVPGMVDLCVWNLCSISVLLLSLH